MDDPIDYKKNCTAFAPDVRFVQYCTYDIKEPGVQIFFVLYEKAV